MVDRHRDAGAGGFTDLSLVASRFSDEPGLVEELVALQHKLLIPRCRLQAEGDLAAHLAQTRLGLVRRGGDPRGESLFDRRQGRRPTVPPIFPWEIAITALPRRLRRALAHQSETADRKRRSLDRAAAHHPLSPPN